MYGYTIFCLSVHPSLDRHLCSFSLLGIVYNEVNMVYKYLFKTLLSVWEHIVIHFKFFEDLPYCFPQLPHHFAFISTVYKCSCFFTFSPILGIFVFVMIIQPTGCEVLTHCNFDLHLLIISGTYFHVLICHLYFSLFYGQFWGDFY